MAQYTEATGRRKESTARVRVYEGTGVFTVNDKELNEYFPVSAMPLPSWEHWKQLVVLSIPST